MTVKLNPRDVADALQIDTYDLARLLTDWAGDALPGPSFETANERGPMSLELFDERVERARRYLAAAHESFDAWLSDNPDDGDDEAA